MKKKIKYDYIVYYINPLSRGWRTKIDILFETIPNSREEGLWGASASPLAFILMTALVMTIGLLVEVEDLCSSLWLFVSESEKNKMTIYRLK